MIEPYFYITTTLPYVNASPHIGFALEIVAADVIARHQRALGRAVVFNTGTDEHGQKIYEKALEENKEPQAYADEYAAHFENLKKLLNLSYTHFIRTTDPQHKKAAQEFWRRCEANGDIYKRMYKVMYCVGCELEKQASELEDGKCPLHPNKVLEVREEENYFFRFSKYQDELQNLYENTESFVVPKGKLAEIASFVEQGLEDFSISRLKEKMPWGIPVPGDDQHVMYVWFDALVNYVSTLGWPEDQANYAKYWPGVQVAGKDNLRQQSAMWQAMLMSAGLPTSAKILINGFINVGGQKMSKSLGNVITPTEMVERYGVDGTRYLLINLGPFGEDMDVTWEKLDTVYTADLANGLGNLCSRLAAMSQKTGYVHRPAAPNTENPLAAPDKYQKLMASYNLGEALQTLITQTNGKTKSVAELDKYLAATQPWKLAATAAQPILQQAIADLLLIAEKLQPLMPATAEQIITHFQTEEIKSMKPLFPRLD